MDRKSSIALFLSCLIAPAILLFPFFAAPCQAKKVSLGWDANPEPDLEGYVVYRNVGSPGPPYKFSSTLPEDELSNPLAPVVTLTGLKENVEYFIAVTAYDSEGNESYFSEEICVEIVDSMIENCTPILSVNTGSGTGGGGGGAGCFVSSVAGGLNYFQAAGVIFAFGLIVLGAFKIHKIRFRQD